MLAEWAYVRLYPSNDARLTSLSAWLDHYNHNRAHSALSGLTPMRVLVDNVNGNHTQGDPQDDIGVPDRCVR
jgi:hypothetical protein